MVSDQEICINTINNSYSDEGPSLDYMKKCLETRIEQLAEEGICLVFSGGVDPSLLLKTAANAAAHAGGSVYTMTFDSRLHLFCGLKIVRRVTGELGGIYEVITVDELEQEAIRNNPINRCYLCKRHLFSKLAELAQAREIRYTLDSTNEDDVHVYRPGIQALKEPGVVSPLAELRIAKAQVKVLISGYGVSMASRPSAPYMATRLPYGTVLDYEVLGRIEAGEAYVRTTVPGSVRLRLHGDTARLELGPEAFDVFMRCRKEIIGRLEGMRFVYITLDVEGFHSGSMDVGLAGPG